MAKTRKPGGGRKPVGPGKLSTFSTRISAETRGALEAEAATSGKSISEVAARLLQLGLELRREKESDDPTRALGHLIRGAAYLNRSADATGRLCEWNTDPSMFEAFRLTLNKLLERLRPSGEIDTSLDGPLLGSPEQRAEQVFRQIWNGLREDTPSSPRELRELERRQGFRPSPDDYLEAVSSGSYSRSRVRRALKIKFDEEKPE